MSNFEFISCKEENVWETKDWICHFTIEKIDETIYVLRLLSIKLREYGTDYMSKDDRFSVDGKVILMGSNCTCVEFDSFESYQDAVNAAISIEKAMLFAHDKSYRQ